MTPQPKGLTLRTSADQRESTSMVVKSVEIQLLPRMTTSRTDSSPREQIVIPTIPANDKGLKGNPHHHARGRNGAQAKAKTRIRTRNQTRNRNSTRNKTRSRARGQEHPPLTSVTTFIVKS
jgi:hypothetical protein